MGRLKAVAAVASAACCVAAAAADAPGRLRDRCVGGEWDALVAQAGVVTSRTNPEYGLSEKLALRCPMFVFTVLIAEWLGPEEKRRAFAEVPEWPPERRMAYFAELWARVMAEDERARRENSSGAADPKGTGARRAKRKLTI